MSSNTETQTGASFTLTLGSIEMTQAENAGVDTIVFEDHVDMVSMVTVKMSQIGESGDLPCAIGDELKLKLGTSGDDVFEGEIIGLEPSFTAKGGTGFTIRALDKVHRLGRGRQTRVFEEMTDSDVVSSVGGDAGLSVEADGTDETLPYILQRNESDIAFLKRLAARNNYILRISGGKLTFKKPQFEGEGYEVKMGENLQDFKISYNTTGMVQKVVVRGWDIEAKEEVVGEASAGDVDAIGSGELGVDVASSFGESTAYVTDVPVSSQSGAKAVAVAEMNRIARQYARGTATIVGNETVQAGTMVTFSGMKAAVNGTCFVVSTRHIVSAATGYRVEFTFCSTSGGEAG
jgi:phage protein D